MDDKTTTVEELKDRIRKFSQERNWPTTDVKSTKDFSVALAVEAAELMEIFQWTHSDEVAKAVSDPDTFTHMQEEIADIFWYLIRICDSCNIDLTTAVFDKAIKNAKKYPPIKD